MKISIIGAGNVGSLTALRLTQENLGDIFIFDVIKGLAKARQFDLEDAQGILKSNYRVEGTDDLKQLAASDIVVLTAGLTRKPGMSREELLHKNAAILKEICIDIKKMAPESMIIVVTNPLDLMTYLVLKTTGFKAKKVLGMGISLDASRFANLISKELNIPPIDIEPCVIGTHGQGMLPLARFTKVKGVALDEFIDDEGREILIKNTINRGAEIVSLLGNASAYFAPAAAIVEIIKIIAKDQKRNLGVCAYLEGEYGARDVCIGVPCRLGKQGIEKIIELDLNKGEKEAFLQSVANLKKQFSNLTA